MFPPITLPVMGAEEFATDAVRVELSRISQSSSPEDEGGALRVVGFPAYLSQGDTDTYLRRAADDSVWLWNRFEPLYRSVFSALSAYFGRCICVSAVAALPGFHVIRTSDRMPYYHGGVPHMDLSQLHVPALAKLGSSAEQYSFTLLLSDEAEDVGLEYWAPGITEAQARTCSRAGFLRYKMGQLAVFSSSLVHRISPFSGRLERISFQGHLIRCSDHFIAYW